MKLHFWGANRQVTGSRYCLDAAGRHVMIDCGMFQERDFLGRNWEPNPLPPARIDALLLTHVHIDHSGLIPRLVKQGFAGPIYCTPPSVDLAEVLLRDSARIQVEDAQYKRRRHQKEGRKAKYPEQPLYDEADVEQVLPQLRPAAYNQPLSLGDGLEVTFREAGHILGSAMLEICCEENGRRRRVVFSGDVGQWNKPIIRDPAVFDQADYVVMESTYGDRLHRDGGNIAQQLARVINRTIERGGNVVIPTFAVERAQELIYHISQLLHQRAIPAVPIYLDSPMAIDVTDIFRKHRDYFDAQSWQRITANDPPLQPPGLHLCRSVEASRAINDSKTPGIIMATSGMCTAGRIKHHLRHNIERPECCVLFVGYQGRGTLGRQILDGQQQVRIHGRHWPVRAEIAQLHGLSGHADRDDLLRWIGNLRHAPRHVFLTHGEEQASQTLAGLIRQQFQWPVTIPAYQDVIELTI